LSRASDVEVMLWALCTAAAAVFDVDGVGVMSPSSVEDSADLRARFLDARGVLQMVEVDKMRKVSWPSGPVSKRAPTGRRSRWPTCEPKRRWLRHSPASYLVGWWAVRRGGRGG